MCSQRLIGRLFAEGESITLYPIRIVFGFCSPDEGVDGVRVLFGVSKRHFKRAVCRNRVKRQMREMYRLSKPVFLPSLPKSVNVAVAFVFCDSKLWSTADLSPRFNSAINKLTARLQSICDNREKLAD